MKQLSVITQLDKLKEGYQGKALAYNPRYAVLILREAFTKSITNCLRKIEGPLYQGELESFILSPIIAVSSKLLSSGTANPGYVIEHFAGQSVGYSIIAQLFATFENKELASTLTQTMIQKSELYKLFTETWSQGKEDLEEKLRRGDGKGANTMIVNALQEWIQGKQPSNPLYKDAQSGLGSAMSALTAILKTTGANSPTVSYGAVTPLYDLLLDTAGTGKGFPLTIEQRKRLFSLYSVAQMAIESLFDQADKQIDEFDRSQYALAGAVLANAFLDYLKMAHDPDVFFPASRIPHDSRAWASSMKAKAVRLASHWLSYVNAPATFSVGIAYDLWKASKSWLDKLGRPYSALVESEQMLDAAMERMKPLSSDLFANIKQVVFDHIKKFTGADEILPQELIQTDEYKAWLEKLDNISSYNYESMTSLIKNMVPSSVMLYRNEDKLPLEQTMVIRASMIVAAAEAAVRSTMLFSADLDTTVAPSSMASIDISDLVIEAPTPASEHEYVGFKKPSPLSAGIVKYLSEDEQKASTDPDIKADAENKLPSWVLKPYLYSPIFLNQLRISLASNIPVLLMWNDVFVPMVHGDALTKQYSVQPIPSLYTSQRNRVVKPYTISEYLRSRRAAVDGVPANSYLRNVATLLDTYGADSQMTARLVDYLSSVMFIYKKGAGDSDWKWVKPECLTVYGVPVALFEKAQKTKPIKSEGTAIVQQSVSLGDTQYLFKLHTHYPVPQKCGFVSYGNSSGEIITVPVRQTVLDAVVSELKKQIEANLDKDPNQSGSPVVGFKLSEFAAGFSVDGTIASYGEQQSNLKEFTFAQAQGWSPFARWCPGQYFDVFSKSDIVTLSALRDYTMQSIAHRINPVTGDLEMRAFLDNELVILDSEDLMNAEDAVDPIVEDAVGREGAVSIRDDESTHAEPEPTPAPTSPAALSPSEKAKAASGIIPAPFAVQQEKGGDSTVVEQKPLAPNGDDPKEKKPTPQAGDPSDSTVTSGSAEAEVWVKDPTAKQLTLKKVKTSQVPSGWVLASEAEIAEWLSKSKGGDESQSE
jgi:hypothetical protein